MSGRTEEGMEEAPLDDLRVGDQVFVAGRNPDREEVPGRVVSRESGFTHIELQVPDEHLGDLVTEAWRPER
jgi:hypothetical protein